MPQSAPERKYFSAHKSAMPLPDLIEVQKKSYKWFFEVGLKELFEEISPIKDFIGRNLEFFFEGFYFDNFGLGTAEFEAVIGEVINDLEAQGFTVDSLVKFKGAFHCYIRFSNLLFVNKLSPHASEKILVKIDTVNQDFAFTPEKKFFDRYGIVEEVMVNPKDILMAQKTIALLERKKAKGRDFFDYTFLHAFTKPNLAYLKHKTGIGSLRELKEKLLARCAEVDFDDMAKDVAPFLFDARDAIRITKFKQYIEQWEVGSL